MVSKDVETRTGVCTVCGPVDIVPKDAGRWACGPGRRVGRQSPNRNRGKGVGGGRTTIKPHGLNMVQAAAFRAGKCCEICGTTENLHVDHCHITKKIRGVLCKKHNTGLGLFGDSAEGLEAALAYLRRHRDRQDPDPDPDPESR